MDNLDSPSSSSSGFRIHSIGFDGSYANDPVMIARGIFWDELRDVLLVLKNCGALRTREERKWCLYALSDLLEELGPADVT
jgi:hypothetical protein